MVDAGAVLSFVVFAVAAFIIFKVVKSILKALFLVLALLAIAIAVLVAAVVIDAGNLKDAFAEGTKIVLMEDGGELVAGVALGDELRPLGEDEVSSYAERIGSGDFAEDEIIFLVARSALDTESGYSHIEGAGHLREQVEQGNQTAYLMAGAAGLFASPLELAKAIKDGSLSVYPEPLTLRLIDYIPLSLFLTVSRSALEALGSAVK